MSKRRKKLQKVVEHTQRNFVAKHMNTFNVGGVHKDKVKYDRNKLKKEKGCDDY